MLTGYSTEEEFCWVLGVILRNMKVSKILCVSDKCVVITSGNT